MQKQFQDCILAFAKLNVLKDKFRYYCQACGSYRNDTELLYLCPDCGPGTVNGKPPKGVLKIEYDYEGLRAKNLHLNQLSQQQWLPLLPIEHIESLPNINAEKSPLFSVNSLDGNSLDNTIWLKDDTRQPTFSFKDRASAVVSAFAKERGMRQLVAASTGNAGSSLAGICAAQQQKAVIIVPAKAPLAKLTQILLYGARLVTVEGSYDDAFDLSVAASEHFGWYNRNTAFNPVTIEGKKTAAFELALQFNSRLPDRIFVPTGDGVILSGLYKGFEDLMKLNLIQKMPVLVAVQSALSNNLVRNLTSTSFTVQSSTTIADSISVDIPRNFYMAKQYLTEYQGEWVQVEDAEILSASSVLSRNTGLFAEPAAAAALAGYLVMQRQGRIESGSNNVIMLTGSGLKDLASLQPMLAMPAPVSPNIESLKKLFA